MKTLLIKNLTSSHLTYEELQSIAIEVEAILNSRPISIHSDDPNDGEALTPAHLLIGCSLQAIPEPVINDSRLSYLSRWQRVTYLKQRFWELWKRDYVHQLQERSKWLHPENNIAKDQLVLIHEDNLPPQCWITGRVVEAIPGADGRVRVADVRTKKGIIRRPICKLAPLPLRDDVYVY
ncbi:uncharacterized protein [Drosophila tropicalis]|uniref:uncharacterized protein n=1 Tax=Drosophila tropicalis TaxID=46794 RepID=UPI0035ABCAC1